jgi:predicted alpha/beta-fold hydrolase
LLPDTPLIPEQGAGAAPPVHRAPWWLPGGHLQTIVPARLLQAPPIAYRRERWETPDDDFIDVDFVEPEPAPAAPVLVLFHGLEGSSQSSYARRMMQACKDAGWRGLVAHFRGCSGEANRQARAYHSGDSAEIDWILRRVAQRWPLAQRHAVGISLGGNALAKWAGERGSAATQLLAAAVAVSAPLDLAAGGHALGQGFNRVYTREFLQTLRPKAIAKVLRFPGLADIDRIAASRSLYEFDDAYTAPAHDFAGVGDYWARASAKPWLGGVALPLLLLNARNDPFVPAPSLPGAGEVARAVRLEQPPHGGHVGFLGAAGAATRWYLPARVLDYFARGV